TWTYTDGNGNSSTQNQSVEISPIDNGVTQIDPITLTADATGYSYQWVDCDNKNAIIPEANSQTFTVTSIGSYAVEVSNGTCSVISNCTEFITVGILEIAQNFVEVYPNPTSGDITVISKKELKSIELMSSLGQIIKRYSFSNEFEVKLSLPLESGIYFIRIETETGLMHFKILNSN
ncbi:MAG: T9SS type A sorting domain-containing protein, partial [Bacteroidia bacterium]